MAKSKCNNCLKISCSCCQTCGENLDLYIDENGENHHWCSRCEDCDILIDECACEHFCEEKMIRLISPLKENYYYNYKQLFKDYRNDLELSFDEILSLMEPLKNLKEEYYTELYSWYEMLEEDRKQRIKFNEMVEKSEIKWVSYPIDNKENIQF